MSNVKAKGKKIREDVECPTFDEAVALLEEDDISLKNWHQFHGDLQRAKDVGIKLTPLQKAVDVMDKDLHEYLKDQSQCEAMVFKMKNDGPDFLADF